MIDDKSIQSRGGLARAASLSSERKSEIARIAAKTRWQNNSPKEIMQEIKIPMSDGRMAVVPFPMNEEDFDLLVNTLVLWKKSLTGGSEKPTEIRIVP